MSTVRVKLLKPLRAGSGLCLTGAIISVPVRQLASLVNSKIAEVYEIPEAVKAKAEIQAAKIAKFNAAEAEKAAKEAKAAKDERTKAKKDAAAAAKRAAADEKAAKKG